MLFQRQYAFSGAVVCLLILAVLFPAGIACAQKSAVPDSPAVPATSVSLIADARIEVLAHYNEAPKPTATAAATGTKRANVTGSIRSGAGYRVIIYSGTDRNKANTAKIDFMRRFPGIRVYMSYAMPQYRVKVGDFSSRSEAAVLYQQLNKVYSPCLIVPDIVEISTFHRANDSVNPSKEP